VGSDLAPARFDLSAPWPNPITSGASIGFATPRPGHVRLAVFDVQGRMVSTLVDGTLEPGRHQARWGRHDARGARATSGVYFVRLEACGQVSTRKMVLLP
jgi:hypothetical protein